MDAAIVLAANLSYFVSATNLITQSLSVITWDCTGLSNSAQSQSRTDLAQSTRLIQELTPLSVFYPGLLTTIPFSHFPIFGTENSQPIPSSGILFGVGVYLFSHK